MCHLGAFRVWEKGRRLFRSEGLSLDLEEMADGLEGEILEIGIRPEDVRVGSEAEQGMQVQVDLVSNAGSHQYVHCRLGQIVFTVHISKDMRLRPGDLVPLIIPQSKLHLFHRGRRVPRSGKR